MVSACMSGTRGSGVLSSTGDVLEMSVVRGVGGVCDMCMCFTRAGVGGVGGEWVGGLDQGGEWVGGLDQGREWWCYVSVSLDSLCRWQVQVYVYCAWRIPAHLRCTQCSILLQLMDICFLTWILMVDIRHLDLFV